MLMRFNSAALMALLLFSCGDVRNISPRSKSKDNPDKKEQSWAEKLIDGEKEVESDRSNPFKEMGETEVWADDYKEKEAVAKSEADKKAQELAKSEADKKAESTNSSAVKKTGEVGPKIVTVEDFKIDRSTEKEDHYYTYSYSEDSYKVFLALNSYEELIENIKKKSKAIIVSKADLRVVQDLVLDKKYSYLLQVPILSYESLGRSILDAKGEQAQAEIKSFEVLQDYVKEFSSYTEALKSKEFWDRVKALADDSQYCMNSKILLSAKTKTNPKTYSFVTSFEKLNDFNEYFDDLFVYEGSDFKDYKFEEFVTYKELTKKVTALRMMRSKLDKRTQRMASYVYDHGEIVMRFDAQWGRLEKLIVDIEKIREGTLRASRHKIKEIETKYVSIKRLVDDMVPDIDKMSKGMKVQTTKVMAKLNQRNNG